MCPVGYAKVRRGQELFMGASDRAVTAPWFAIFLQNNAKEKTGEAISLASAIAGDTQN